MTESLRRAWTALAGVTDPELPVLTLQELGVIRNVESIDGSIVVTITPTYSGCSAMPTMRQNILDALYAAGFQKARVIEVLTPAWTTDWITAAGRNKLLTYGVVPPPRKQSESASPDDVVWCPNCGSSCVQMLSRFGSTLCKGLWRCETCREPFEAFKCI